MFGDCPTYVVRVQDGHVIDVTFSDPDVARREEGRIPKTVDDFYGVIDDAGDADSLKVTYNDVGFR